MSRRLRIGIVDLIARRPTRSPYAKLMYPNFASIAPQAIGVWCEQLGHRVRYTTYTGREDVERDLPDDIDLLFVCAFTSAAYLAYSISNRFRRRRVVTILGGPHARAYGADAARYFDYVVGFADRELILDLLQGLSAHREGVWLSAKRQPASLPGIRERWKFVQMNLGKAGYYGFVPTIGSLGCPYRCAFCVDAEVSYQTLPYDQIREDLAFVLEQRPRPAVGWHDPNFGVRFDDYLGIVEESVPPGEIVFACESSLSLLSDRNLKRLQRNGFRGIVVGVENWHDFNDKAGMRRAQGVDKVEAAADHISRVADHIPYTQANFIMGLDSDAGTEPFELTKRFLDLAPTAYPAYSLLTAFGNSAPLNRELEVEGRVLRAPYPLLDCASVHNVRLKNYRAADFYGQLADLLRYSYSPGASWKRFQRNSHPLNSAPRWMTAIRSFTSRSRARYYDNMRDLAVRTPEFGAFLDGESRTPPAILRRQVRRDLGPYYDSLPEGVRRYLEGPAA